MYIPKPKYSLLTAATAAGSTVVAVAVLASPSQMASAAGGGAATPQVIAFPSRDFVSVAEPGGTTPTTTWTHKGAVVQKSTSKVPGLPTAMGLNDINHLGLPCWSSSLVAKTSNMSPGDTITVTTPSGIAAQKLSMKVAKVKTIQAARAPGSSTKVVVTGSAKDPVTGRQVAPGNLQVRLVSKRLKFSFNGRRDLRAVLGGGKDGVMAYRTPGSLTDFSFTASFQLLGGKNTTLAMARADARQAFVSQTRGIVQNNALAPTTITIYETPVVGDGTVHGNAPGCPVP